MKDKEKCRVLVWSDPLVRRNVVENLGLTLRLDVSTGFERLWCGLLCVLNSEVHAANWNRELGCGKIEPAAIGFGANLVRSAENSAAMGEPLRRGKDQ